MLPSPANGLVILTVTCVAVALWADARAFTAVRAVAKIGASVAFIAIGWRSGLPTAGALGQLTLAALLLSAVGDIALIRRGKAAVGGGLGAFLLAHIAYTLAIASQSFAVSHVVGWALGLLFLVVPTARWLLPHTGALRPAVIGYIAAITVMTATALAAWSHQSSWLRAGIALSALVFAASDVFVARQRFVHKDPRNRQIGLPLYYAAQLGFAHWMVHL